MNSNTCLLEPALDRDAPRPGLVCLEIFVGAPITDEEKRLRLDRCLYVSEVYEDDDVESINERRRVVQTNYDLVDRYIAMSRCVINREPAPYPVRNRVPEDADSRFQPLNDVELRDFRSLLFHWDAQRYYISFTE